MKTMRALDSTSTKPPWSSIPTSRPTRWSGRSIEWLSDKPPIPVILGAFSATEVGGEIFVLGARYALTEARIEGRSYDQGFFVEYFVVNETLPGEWKTRRLLQRGGLTYAQSDDCQGFVAARAIQDPGVQSSFDPPRWKASAAIWPTHNGQPMRFLGQLALTDSAVARTLFTWGVNAYLFTAQADNDLQFQIFEQEANQQTAEEHYADEARRAKLIAGKPRRQG